MSPRMRRLDCLLPSLLQRQVLTYHFLANATGLAGRQRKWPESDLDDVIVLLDP
jgi:hypothetical protein